MAETKTNPMRHLDKLGIPYTVHSLPPERFTTGSDMAEMLGEDHSRVFKTLVTMAKSKKYYVFVIPVDLELDLKKAAASVGEKSVEMLPSKQLLSITGYVHGGCSPMCMKRDLITVVDSTAKDGDVFYVSAGKVGWQLELSTEDFFRSGDFLMADLVRPKSVQP